MHDFGMNPFSLRWIALLATVFVQVALASDQAGSARSAESLVAQAVRYEHGEGVARNPRRAAELYCAAARRGSPEAAYRLGSMYANGRGIERDDRYAVALYQRAAAQGHDYAKRMLRVIRSEDPVLPDCVAAPVSALIARAERTRIEHLEKADRARTEAALAELARSEQLALAERARADIAKAELAKAKQIARTERAKADRVARGEQANADTAAAEAAATDEKQKVSAAIEVWLAAWSRKDIEAYLAAYAQDFAVPGGRLRQQWENERRARIVGKSWIAVKISALEIRLNGKEAHARFLQDYRSNRLSESSRKSLTLIKTGDRWLIQQEQSAE